MGVMKPLHRFGALALIVLLAALPARAQLFEYFGNGAIVGTDGPAPEFLSPDGAVVEFSYVFDASAGPIATTSVSATYAGVSGLVAFSESDVRSLDNVILTITRDTANGDYAYFFSGFTAEGWEVVHFAFSMSPDFVPDLSLPTSSPPFPEDDPGTAGYVDVRGPDDEWTAYSDADFWFNVAVLVPENRATGGTASANKEKLPNEGAANAFDGSKYTKWFTGTASSQGWLQYHFAGTEAWAVIRYDLTSGNDVANRDPRDWEFQGSHDGVNWTTLDTQSGVLFSARRQTKQYSITNSTAYEYYRLNITATRGSGGGIQLSELALMAY